MPNSRQFLAAIFVLSMTSNALTLASPIFMMQVYDRVMVSHSLPTLIALLVIVAILQGTQGIIHHFRARLFRRYANYIDVAFEEAAFQETVAPQTKTRTWEAGISPLQHLSNMRTFITGNGLAALFDAPWAILFAVIMFMLHPWLGLLATGFTISIAGFSLAGQLASSKKPGANENVAIYRDSFRDLAKTQTIRGYGLYGLFNKKWLEARMQDRSDRASAQALPDFFRTCARSLKNIQSSAILALAAYLTLENQATFGVMMASSIIAGRMSAPVDGLINGWKNIRAARKGWPKLKALTGLKNNKTVELKDLSSPTKSLELINLSVANGENRILSGISFKLLAGESIGLIGPTGAGKSTLLNVIAGALELKGGKLKFDDIERKYWRDDKLGSTIGFLPQEIVFLNGTIAENIARFAAEKDNEQVIAATRAIGIHEIIDQMPEGYETQILNSGREFPTSFRVKLGLARAFYNTPFLLLLDNPTGNLDRDGEMNLAEYLRNHKERGGIAIMATSHMQPLMMVDQVAVLQAGKIASLGKREELFKPVAGRGEPRPMVKPILATMTIQPKA